jgi:hypothetical protein
MKRLSVLLPVLYMGLAFVMLFSSSPLASAATNQSGGNGLRVSPVRTDLTLAPGKVQTLNVTVNNVTASTATFQVVINDFTANKDETGDPALILDSGQFSPKHSLKRFIQPVPNFTLKPGEQKTIPVTIKVPSDATGGGYYGAIRFAPASADPNDTQTVTLAGSVGTLVLLRVPGDIKDLLSIASFDVRNNDNPSSFFMNNKGLDAVVRFQNQGNIQEQPFGRILLKNRSGKILASYEVNNVSPRGNVLPDSIRKFTIPLKKVGSFGQFKVEGNFGYGPNGQLLSASTTFYVIPVALIVAFIGLVLFLAFLIFGLPRLVRAYNRHVIRQSRRR